MSMFSFLYFSVVVQDFALFKIEKQGSERVADLCN